MSAAGENLAHSIPYAAATNSATATPTIRATPRRANFKRQRLRMSLMMRVMSEDVEEPCRRKSEFSSM
jgi:hypothetical protein